MKYLLHHTISKVGLPLIVTSTKPSLCFLIDTGATNNVIFSFAYEHLKSVGNIHTTSIYSVLDSHKAVATIQNETGIQIHGILGIPFLTQNKWILDFNKLTIKTSEI